MAVKNNKQKMAAKAAQRNSVFSKLKLPSIKSKKAKQASDKQTEATTESGHDTHPKRAYAEMTSRQISEEIAQIKVLLEQSKYVDIFSDALAPKGTPEKIEEILYKDDDFKAYACYHNRNVAHYYACDVAGLGVIQVLLDSQKLPGHERITDIGFNSNNFMTVETNKHKFVYGNKKGEPEVNRRIMDNIINLMTQQNGTEGHAFTKTYPLYNGSNKANYLRISATHASVSPYGATLSIRVATPELAITEKNFNTMAPMNKDLNVLRLLAIFVKCHVNMMISAPTGAGKTELQKLLIKYIPFEDRIVLVEDTDEMHLPELYPKKDIFSWLSGDIEGRNTITDLVIQSLRNEPKWLIVAETRGAEAYEMFQGVKTDHSIITTLHATTNDTVPSRFAGMIQTKYANLETKTLENDFLDYMDIGIHLTKRSFNGVVIRYIDEIAEYVPVSKKYPHGVNILFKQHINSAGIRTYYSNSPTAKLQRKFVNEQDRILSKHEWPVIPKSHPKKEIINRELYNIYHKKSAILKKERQNNG